MFLLHQLTIVPGKPGLTEASVSLGRVPVDALATVVARVVQTLVAVNAAFTVVGHLLAPGTAIAWQKLQRGKEKKRGRNRKSGISFFVSFVNPE